MSLMVSRQIARFRYARPDPPRWRVRFDVEHPPAPGEYMLADFEPPLRKPLFPSAIEETGFTSYLEPGHAATQLLPGAEVDMLGPLGRGFHVGDRVSRLLLAAEVRYLPILMPLYSATSAVVLVVEARTRGQLPAPAHFPPGLELVLITHDGSAGYPGQFGVGDVNPRSSASTAERVGSLIRWADAMCVAFDRTRYPPMGQLIRETRIQPRERFAQAWVRVPMPCGVGACEVCRIRTRRGERRACTDGPVFDLLDIL